MTTIEALENLFSRFIDLSQKLDHSLPKVSFDSEWTSVCTGDANPNEQGLVEWQPTPREGGDIFSHLERALEVQFHSDFIDFFSHYWSEGLIVSHALGEMSLIQIWNKEDEEMLKENLLGHCFAKRKNKLPLTLFIGCTVDDEVIALDNATGNIVLERAGYPAHQTIASHLAEFLGQLTPSLKPYND